MRRAVLYIWIAALLLLPGAFAPDSHAQARAVLAPPLPTVAPSQNAVDSEQRLARVLYTQAFTSAAPTPSPAPTPEPTPEPVPEPDKWVALTFDDGPHPTYTRRLLDILERFDAHCTFFVLGERVELYPGVVREVVEAGHSIGNHSYSHLNPKTASQQALLDEIERTNQVVYEDGGVWPTLFRPPYGAIPRTTKTLGDMQIVHWTVDSLDWSLRDAEKTYEHTLPYVADGSIILMHDIHETTLEAAERLLQALSDGGYGFVTVEALMEMVQ